MTSAEPPIQGQGCDYDCKTRIKGYCTSLGTHLQLQRCWLCNCARLVCSNVL
jgi:hypothetical protein